MASIAIRLCTVSETGSKPRNERLLRTLLFLDDLMCVMPHVAARIASDSCSGVAAKTCFQYRWVSCPGKGENSMHVFIKSYFLLDSCYGGFPVHVGEWLVLQDGATITPSMADMAMRILAPAYAPTSDGPLENATTVSY
jgi:hypothetical protein